MFTQAFSPNESLLAIAVGCIFSKGASLYAQDNARVNRSWKTMFPVDTKRDWNNCLVLFLFDHGYGGDDVDLFRFDFDFAVHSFIFGLLFFFFSSF